MKIFTKIFVWGIISLSILITACQPEPDSAQEIINKEINLEGEMTLNESEKKQPVVVLPDLGAAPEIDNAVWINSEPLSMAGLQGKVVLVEFWTFG